MSFVKFGIDSPMVKTEFAVDGIPIRQYLDIVTENKRLHALVGKLVACCDDERDAALIQEAHALLARIKGE